MKNKNNFYCKLVCFQLFRDECILDFFIINLFSIYGYYV